MPRILGLAPKAVLREEITNDLYCQFRFLFFLTFDIQHSVVANNAYNLSTQEAEEGLLYIWGQALSTE